MITIVIMIITCNTMTTKNIFYYITKTTERVVENVYVYTLHIVYKWIFCCFFSFSPFSFSPIGTWLCRQFSNTYKTANCFIVFFFFFLYTLIYYQYVTECGRTALDSTVVLCVRLVFEVWSNECRIRNGNGTT